MKQPELTDSAASYGQLLDNLETRIRAAQVKAALSVNRELIEVYWHIGKPILERQRTERWGNIWRMRGFHLA